MRLVRSWPARIPEGRSYVVDDIEKLVMGHDPDDPENSDHDFDYKCLNRIDDDIVLIEWDIAVGGEQLARFMDRAKAEPDRVRVAPYLLYRGGAKPNKQQVPFYVHRVREPGHKRWVAGPEDKFCHLFGFGLVYLPRYLVREFTAAMKPGDLFTDTTFSRWHMVRAPHRDVPIDWDCHAVHLHYNLPQVPS